MIYTLKHWRNRQMSSTMHNPLPLIAQPLNRSQHMLFYNINLPLHLIRSHIFSRLQVMFHLLKNPRPTNRPTPNHHSINTILIKTLSRPLWSCNITIPNNRNSHSRIILHLTNQCPISLTSIHLRSRTPMNRQRLSTTILYSLCQINNNFRLVIPTQTRLHRNRYLHRLNHSLRDSQQLRHITQHARTSPLTSNLLHWAPKIQIQNIRSRLFHNPCSLHHRIHILAINLYRHRSLLIMYSQLLLRTFHITYQSISTNKLCINHIRSKSFTQQSECRIRHILHRSQKQRLFTKLYITYFHTFSNFYF